MLCENCHVKEATVHVTEIDLPGAGGGKGSAPGVHEKHLCELCAQSMDLPHAPAVKKTMADIWKLLQMSAQQGSRKKGPVCPSCGMTLDEFRRKGRLGCSKDYEIFKAHLGELLERVHGARRHVGRLPGVSEVEVDRLQQLAELRQRLEVAIREEAYEDAARLRDEIQAIEREPEPSPGPEQGA